VTIDLESIDPTVNHNKTPAAPEIKRATRPETLAGKVVALLDNRKEQGELILRTVGDTLRERHGVERVVFRRKAHYSKNAAGEIIDELAREAHVAVVALGG
jgi:hypothetical protein